MKKITYLLLIIFSLGLIGLGLYLEFNKEKKEEPKEFSYMPLMYKICDDDSCIYALGSIHLGDERVNKFDKKVIDAYNSTDTLVVELDTTNETLDLTEYLLEDGKTLDDIIDEDLKQKLLDFEDKHPLFNYEIYKMYDLGYLYLMLVSMSYIESGYMYPGVDSYFLNKAHEDNKEIIELETLDYQMDILTNSSDEFYIDSINQLLDNYDLIGISIKMLYNSYINADLETLKVYLQFDDALTEEEQKFEDDLYTNRNFSMTDEVKKLLEENKNAFVVVGSAHVIGDDGIVENLKNDYKIELIKD